MSEFLETHIDVKVYSIALPHLRPYAAVIGSRGHIPPPFDPDSLPVKTRRTQMGPVFFMPHLN